MGLRWPAAHQRPAEASTRSCIEATLGPDLAAACSSSAVKLPPLLDASCRSWQTFSPDCGLFAIGGLTMEDSHNVCASRICMQARLPSHRLSLSGLKPDSSCPLRPRAVVRQSRTGAAPCGPEVSIQLRGADSAARWQITIRMFIQLNLRSEPARRTGTTNEVASAKQEPVWASRPEAS